jgi:hypothetical protein
VNAPPGHTPVELADILDHKVLIEIIDEYCQREIDPGRQRLNAYLDGKLRKMLVRIGDQHAGGGKLRSLSAPVSGRSKVRLEDIVPSSELTDAVEVASTKEAQLSLLSLKMQEYGIKGADIPIFLAYQQNQWSVDALAFHLAEVAGRPLIDDDMARAGVLSGTFDAIVKAVRNGAMRPEEKYDPAELANTGGIDLRHGTSFPGTDGERQERVSEGPRVGLGELLSGKFTGLTPRVLEWVAINDMRGLPGIGGD